MTGFLIFLTIVVIVCVIVASRASGRRSGQSGMPRDVSVRRERRGGDGGSDTGPSGPFSVSVSVQPSRAKAEPRIAAPTEPFRWCGRGEVVGVHGFEVRDPLTYFGAPDRRERTGQAIDPSQVDRSLRAAAAADAPPLPYWPWYAQMTPEQRYVYLKWLASDRKALPPSDGYLFVYYYGLERRTLVDDTDHDLVFAEVQRLRSMHAAQSQTRSRSFQNYSSAFLWYLVAVRPTKLDRGHVKALVQSTTTWSEDSLAAALAWFVDRQEALRPWMAYVIAQESPLSQRSVVVRRLDEQFRTLFTRRVEAEFEKGMILKSSKRARQVTYRPASAALQPVTAVISNPLGIPSQFQRLSEIWNDCVAELRKLSSVAREGMPETLTAEAWEAMPPELRAGIDHPQSPAICALVAKNTDETGHTFVRTSDLATALGFEQRAKLTARQSQSISATAEHAGFAVEPDVRLTGRNYAWDDLLAVFPHAYEGEPDYRRYGGAACILRLGIEIAEADGRIDDAELGRVMGQIETGFQLNEHERRRLEALRELLLKTGSDVGGLGKRLQAVLDVDGRRAIGRLLVAVAGIDGVISKGELAALRRCFRALDLPPDLLEAIIGELAPSVAETPVPVITGRPAPVGERIPAARAAEGVITLDRARIMSIMEETREVSVLLAEAMRAEAEHADGEPIGESVEPRRPPSPHSPVAVATMPIAARTARGSEVAAAAPAAGPPARYASFYAELVAKERWPHGEADALARRHGHMLSGALEAINDWAFERVASQLVYEDGDVVVVERSVLESVGK